MSVITMASRFVMKLFCCNDCNESRYFEKKLKPNFSSGQGKEISADEIKDVDYSGRY